MKECRSCGEIKKLDDFLFRNDTKRYRPDCKKCLYESRKDYFERYRKEKGNENVKKYYERNPLKKSEFNKKWNEKNPEYYKNYQKNRRDNDELFKLTGNIRCLIKNSLINNTLKKKKKTEKILGISFNGFKLYLESKFEDWMTWENYGKYNGDLNYGWDIDHITPLSSAKNEEEMIKLNHYTNLQPLCSKVNRDIKKDRLNYGE